MAVSQLEVDKQQLNSTGSGASTTVTGPVGGK
jgi:hypothetical protein